MESSLVLFNISHFSSANCLEVISKRRQKDAGEERSHIKIEADDEFGLEMQRKESEYTCLYCIRKLREKPDLKVNYL